MPKTKDSKTDDTDAVSDETVTTEEQAKDTPSAPTVFTKTVKDAEGNESTRTSGVLKYKAERKDEEGNKIPNTPDLARADLVKQGWDINDVKHATDEDQRMFSSDNPKREKNQRSRARRKAKAAADTEPPVVDEPEKDASTEEA